MLKQILPFGGKTIATLLCTNELLLSYLEADELVISNHWSRSFELHTDQFGTLIEHYICLNRVAFFASINIYHIEERLKRCGVEIVLNYSYQSSTLKLIAATLKNHNAIQNIVKPTIDDQYLGYILNDTQD